MPIDCVVGLGTNLGDRLRLATLGVAAIAARAEVTAVSSLYETAPVGGPPQSHFLNAAVRVRWDGSAIGLLDALLVIERRFGRERAERWGPRTLDLDVLWIPRQAIRSRRLVVPHPRLLERPFALVPLVEVAPFAKDPVTGRSFGALCDGVLAADIRRVAPVGWHRR